MTTACVRSGFCCKQAPCPFGTWDEDKKQCSFLGGERPGEYFCEKYDEILQLPPEVGANIAPAFGAGCCSSLNSDRREVLISLTRAVDKKHAES